jgi:hypothetical protein
MDAIPVNINIKFQLNGWYLKDAYLKKNINNNSSLCLNCFTYCLYDTIIYSKILQINKEKKIALFYCICNSCYEKIKDDDSLFIKAPNNVKIVWELYFKIGKIDALHHDLKIIFQDNLTELDSLVHKYKFDHNEKVAIINCLKNENKKLSTNLELELDKFKILEQQKLENDKLLKQIKEQYHLFSKTLMYENNKVINEKIEQLSQINNIKKYNTTECKICLNCDVTIALQCGHLLCENCYSNIIKTTNKENYELIGTSNKIIDDMDIIECPVCRTVSTSCIHIYF